MHTKSSSSSSSVAAPMSSAPGSAAQLVLVDGDTVPSSSNAVNGIEDAADGRDNNEAGPSKRREGGAAGRKSLRASAASASLSPAPSPRQARSASIEESLTIVKAEAPSTSLLGGASSSHVATAGKDNAATTTDQANDPLRTEILPAPPSLPYDISYPPLHPTLILPPPPAPNETRKPAPLPKSVTEMPMVSELPRAAEEGVPPADERGGIVLPAAIRRNLEEKRERKTNGEEQKTWLTRAGTKRRGPPPSSAPASKARKTTTTVGTGTKPGSSAAAAASSSATEAGGAGNPTTTAGLSSSRTAHQAASTGKAPSSSLAAAAASSDADSVAYAAGQSSPSSPPPPYQAASSPYVTVDEGPALLPSPPSTGIALTTPSTGQPFLTPLESAMPQPSSPRSDTDAAMSEVGPATARSDSTAALALQGVSSGYNGTGTAPSSPSPSTVATPQPKRKQRARRSELENLAFEGLPNVEDRARSPSPALDIDGGRRPRAAHRKPRVAISWSARGGSASFVQDSAPTSGKEDGHAAGTAHESSSASKKVKVEALSSYNPSGIAPNGKGKAVDGSRGRASDVAASDQAGATTSKTRQTRSGTPSSAQAQAQQQVALTPWELASKTRTPVKELAIARLREKAEAASASSSPALGTKELPNAAGSEASHAAPANQEAIPNMDQCCVCLGTGQFLCCDGCPRSFHFNCMDPPLDIGEMPAPQPQPTSSSSQDVAATPKKEKSTDEESWFCNVCRAERRAKAASSAPKPPKRKPGTADAIFGPLLEQVDSTTQSTFALPPDVRNHFRGVATASDGSYVNVQLLRPIKVNSKTGVTDERDPYKLKDRHGKPVLCYRCGGSALPLDEGEQTQGKAAPPTSSVVPAAPPAGGATPAAQDIRGGWRKMVSCDFCDQHWHLDCLEPPMVGMPGRLKKWMCPNHIDNLLPRQRVPKAPAAAPQVVPLPVPSEKTIGPGLHYRTRVVNDGHIDIIPDPLDTFFDADGKGKGSGLGAEIVEMPSPADSLAPKIRYAVPEKVVRLDFWQAVDARRNLKRAGADAFPAPSTPLDLLARIASSKLHVARARPVQKLVRQALQEEPPPSAPIEYPYLADDEIPISSMRSSVGMLDEDEELEEDERLAASAAAARQEGGAATAPPRPRPREQTKWASSGASSVDSAGDSMDMDEDEREREQDGESLPTQDTSLTLLVAPSSKPSSASGKGAATAIAKEGRDGKDTSDRSLLEAATTLRSASVRGEKQEPAPTSAGTSEAAMTKVEMSEGEARSLRAVRELLRLKGEEALMRFLLAEDEGEV